MPSPFSLHSKIQRLKTSLTWPHSVTWTHSTTAHFVTASSHVTATSTGTHSPAWPPIFDLLGRKELTSLQSHLNPFVLQLILKVSQLSFFL